MCFKLNCGNELDTVKGLMEMSLNGIMMSVFDLEPDDFQPTDALVADLGMTAEQKTELRSLVSEYFDGIVLDFTQVKTAQDLFDTVVNASFSDVEEFMMAA